MIDLQVEKNFDFKDLENSSTKDNLFELIMLRLESMRPYKSIKKHNFSFQKQLINDKVRII